MKNVSHFILKLIKLAEFFLPADEYPQKGFSLLSSSSFLPSTCSSRFPSLVREVREEMN